MTEEAAELFSDSSAASPVLYKKILKKGCQNIMITLTKLNGTKFVLNCDLIETIQENPDTTIRLSNGNVYIVKEPSDMVVDLTTEFRRGILSDILNVNK
jgi:flagellar protein FlbD